MEYPKYIKTRDGYIGVRLDIRYDGIPIYRFEGGMRMADNWELEHGSDNREDLLKG